MDVARRDSKGHLQWNGWQENPPSNAIVIPKNFELLSSYRLAVHVAGSCVRELALSRFDEGLVWLLYGVDEQERLIRVSSRTLAGTEQFLSPLLLQHSFQHDVV
eukprot:scaffold3073_cov66-Cylindrotheca_fusiformis.AAC.8